MRQGSSATARAIAATALVCGFVLVLAVVTASIDGEERGPGTVKQNAGKAAKQRKRSGAPRAYVVQNGDTLTSIARRTGVPVSRIEALNPGVDPQILVSGERLKLR